MIHPFVNYAHRGASAYTPENTMLAFYTGLYMGANGIETDIQRTKDGVLVLFHDRALERAAGLPGRIADYTLAELQQLTVTKGSYSDRIATLEDFLQHFAFRDLTFAIELKAEGVEADTARMLRRYAMADKTVVTSFNMDYLLRFHEAAPEFQLGLLAREVTDELVQQLRTLGFAEICPKAEQLTPELSDRLHRAGFRVRAWGVSNEELMRHVVACGADGMTVDFPDRLTALLQSR